MKKPRRKTEGYNEALRSLSVVIPAYNEEKRLLATLQQVERYLDDSGWTPYEILVVDDGSTDGTPALVRAFAEDHPEVRLLRNPGNRGKGYSVRHGMLAAVGEWRLFTDADLSAPIAEIDKLRKGIEEHGADVAIGSRALDRSLIQIHQSALRENAGRLFNLFLRFVTGLDFWDTQCGFKLFRAEAAQRIFSKQLMERFGFDAEILYLAKKYGFKTVEIPVRWAHADGTKVNMISDSLDMFFDLFLIRWNDLKGRY